MLENSYIARKLSLLLILNVGQSLIYKAHYIKMFVVTA